MPKCAMPNAQMRDAQCPMPDARCPMPKCAMPNAQCAMPNAQCPTRQELRRLHVSDDRATLVYYYSNKN
jgi:hypothetical protein